MRQTKKVRGGRRVERKRRDSFLEGRKWEMEALVHFERS